MFLHALKALLCYENDNKDESCFTAKKKQTNKQTNNKKKNKEKTKKKTKTKNSNSEELKTILERT